MSEELDGKVKIHVHVEEKIGLANYSNVTIGASITRLVDEGTDEEILTHIRETARNTVEEFLAEERENVLEMVRQK